MQSLKSAIKIQNLKLFQSLKIGNVEETYLQDAKYEMVYHPYIQVISIKDRRNPQFHALTSPANAPWMHPIDEIYEPLETIEKTIAVEESIITDETVQQKTVDKVIKGSGKKKG